MYALLALALTMNAQAGRHSEIEIDNETRGEIEVFIDGHRYGNLRRGDKEDFRVSPGNHQVQVYSYGTPLVNQWVSVPYGREVEIEVEDRFGTVRIDNDGNAPLYVQGQGIQGFWVNPGGRFEVQAPAGTLPITASAQTGRGLQVVYSQNLNVRGGRTVSHDIDWCTRQVAVAPARPVARPPARPARPVGTIRASYPSRPR